MFTKIAKKLETLFGVPAIVWMTWQDVDELSNVEKISCVNR